MAFNQPTFTYIIGDAQYLLICCCTLTGPRRSHGSRSSRTRRSGASVQNKK